VLFRTEKKMYGSDSHRAYMEEIKSAIYGKNAKKVGVTPSIALINPKFARNVATTIRLASCYGIPQVWYTGNRISLDPKSGERLPREERIKGYKDVDLIQNDYFFDQFEKDVVPVAIEVRQNSEHLLNFEHPEKALYVFGPEDGSIPKVILQHCHRFVIIPTRHCLNLSTAAATVLYDRMYKNNLQGKTDLITPGEWEGRKGQDSFRDAILGIDE